MYGTTVNPICLGYHIPVLWFQLKGSCSKSFRSAAPVTIYINLSHVCMIYINVVSVKKYVLIELSPIRIQLNIKILKTIYFMTSQWNAWRLGVRF